MTQVRAAALRRPRQRLRNRLLIFGLQEGEPEPQPDPDQEGGRHGRRPRGALGGLRIVRQRRLLHLVTSRRPPNDNAQENKIVQYFPYAISDSVLYSTSSLSLVHKQINRVLTGCKLSSLNAPGTETPQSHPY